MKRICFLGSLLLVLLTIACRKETITLTGLMHIPLGRHLEIGTGLTYQRSAQWFRGTVTEIEQQQIPSDSATWSRHLRYCRRRDFQPAQYVSRLCARSVIATY